MKPRRQNTVSGEVLTITQRRNTRAKTSDNEIEGFSLPIPLDVIIEIFSRLPLKSIAICRCVSKLWSSILGLQDFTDLFLTKSSTRPQLLFALRKGKEMLFYSSPQPQDPDENYSVSATPLMNFSDFNFDSSSKISGLVHGLVCLVDQRISKRKKERRARVKCLLGYDPVDKQFKVLSMTQSRDDMCSEEHQVLTLGIGKLSWRMIQCSIPHLYPSEAICINGVLYYTSLLYRDRNIVSFDVRSEKFSPIEVNRAVYLGDMINYNGKLGLITSGSKVGLSCGF